MAAAKHLILPLMASFRPIRSSPSRLRPPFRRFPAIRAPSSSSSPPHPSPSSNSQGGGYKGPKPGMDLVADWVSGNDGLVRSLPIYVGGISLLAVLINRAFSGIALVADANSSQSRADILTLALAVTSLLAGLVWLSIQPKIIFPVVPCGVECRRLNSGVPCHTRLELLWAWKSLSSATCSRSLVVIYGDDCLLQIGVAAESSTERSDALPVDTYKLIQGSLYTNVMESGKQNYLANLSLYPARTELPFLPTNTQAVILQPIGNRGIAIIGGDTIRGFSNLDQAWISSIAEKLDATLSKY